MLCYGSAGSEMSALYPVYKKGVNNFYQPEFCYRRVNTDMSTSAIYISDCGKRSGELIVRDNDYLIPYQIYGIILKSAIQG